MPKLHLFGQALLLNGSLGIDPGAPLGLFQTQLLFASALLGCLLGLPLGQFGCLLTSLFGFAKLALLSLLRLCSSLLCSKYGIRLFLNSLLLNGLELA